MRSSRKKTGARRRKKQVMSKTAAMHRTSLFVPPGLYQALIREGRRSGVTVSEVNRKALEAYLKGNKGQSLETRISSVEKRLKQLGTLVKGYRG